MRRWNGWGDEQVQLPLAPEAKQFLLEVLGQAKNGPNADLNTAIARLSASRLADTKLWTTNSAQRIRYSLGQSLPDWLQLRYGLIAQVPDAVAFPESREEVRAVLQLAAQQGCVVIPYGGGTSVAGHVNVQASSRPVITLVMQRMMQLQSLDTEAQLATFGAGVLGPDLEAQLRARGFTLGHFPQSFEYSSLGGWVVTRSSGQQSLGYGRIEAMFAGGHLETPGGSLDIRAFPASAAGTDLREIVLGSEGRIGVLTDVTVRVQRLPEKESFIAVCFPDWESGRQALRQMAQQQIPLSMLRLSNAAETATSLKLAGHVQQVAWLERYLRWRGCAEQKCMAIIGASGSALQVRQALQQAKQVWRQHSGIGLGTLLGKKWQHGRFRNVYLRNTLWEMGYAIDTVETATDWSRITPLMQAVEQAARGAFAEEGEAVHTYTHLSHVYTQGASVYTTFVYRLSGDYQTDLRCWQRLKRAASEAITTFGGTISHQHGVGLDHAPYLHVEKGQAGLEVIRSLYRHFDPQDMMNPGKCVAAKGD